MPRPSAFDAGVGVPQAFRSSLPADLTGALRAILGRHLDGGEEIVLPDLMRMR